ncbi:MAG: hypothetical protein KA885_01980, partial [Spirochaetes bacterium]|nr:hypothetical protein [Spirochaetota bacterium]
MNIIFTASYLSMRETFDIILDNENDFLIVTPNEKSYNFFKLLYNENKVYFTSKVFKASFFINFLSTVLKLISQFLKLCFFYSESMRLIINIISEIIPTYIKKKNIWDYFKDLKNNNVFFWETGYCYFEDWLIYKLSKTNKVIYI